MSFRSKVSGDANESQIVTSLQMYMYRSRYLHKSLNDAYRLLRYETCTKTHLILKVRSKRGLVCSRIGVTFLVCIAANSRRHVHVSKVDAHTNRRERGSVLCCAE